jgi:hypothetical protein
MSLERFKKSSREGARISLRKSRSIGLNSSTIEQYFSRHEWAVLYYDDDDRRVGIEPKLEQAEDAYKIQKRNGENQGGSINATSFMREFDLIPNKTKQYRALLDEETGLVCIDVNNPVLTYDS